MTYLDLVNKILVRLRERTVASVDETAYSKLLGIMVNDAMDIVQNAWNWSSLRSTLVGTTSQGIFNYELNAAGNNFTPLNVYNITEGYEMILATPQQMDKWFLLNTPVEGAPRYYVWNGASYADNDTQVDLYPIPDGVYDIHFNIVLRQLPMTLDDEELRVPVLPVEHLAYAMAVEERGEDNGIMGASAYATAQQSLSDAIALDSGKHQEELIYQVV